MVSLDKTPTIDQSSEEYELSESLLPQYNPKSTSQPVSVAVRRRRGGSICLTFVSICCCGVLVVLATPLVLLYKQGVLVEGLSNALRPQPDYAAFPTNVGYAGPTPSGSE